jgi:hypothetical protein
MFDWHGYLGELCPPIEAREPIPAKHEGTKPRRKGRRAASEPVELYDKQGYSTLAHVQGGHGGLVAGEAKLGSRIYAAIQTGSPNWFELLAVQMAVNRPERQALKPSLLGPAAFAEAKRALAEEGRRQREAGKSGYFRVSPRVAEPRREVHALKDVPWQNEHGYWHPWAGNEALAGKFAAMPYRQQSVIRSLTRAWFGDRTICGTTYPQWMNPLQVGGGKRKTRSTDKELVAEDGGGSHELAGRSRVLRVVAAQDAVDRGVSKEWIELAAGSVPAWWAQLPEARKPRKTARKSRATVDGRGRGKPAKHANDEERRATRAAAARARRAAENGAA